ncbi:MAG: hypothetical protein J6K62_02475 [Clostridia bacterium]|nr:hypothetical protein [Clostridia bacterium]
MTDWNCEECENFDYDEETDTYECLMNLDMDDFERFALSRQSRCPFFRIRDDYRIVRRQN